MSWKALFLKYFIIILSAFKKTSHSPFEDSLFLKERSITLIKKINDLVVKLKDSFVATTLKPSTCGVKELWSKMNAVTSLDDRVKKRRSTSIEEVDENAPISPTVQHAIMSEEEEKVIVTNCNLCVLCTLPVIKRTIWLFCQFNFTMFYTFWHPELQYVIKKP